MLPSLLTSRLKTLLSSDYTAVIEAFSHERKGSFRLNLLNSDGGDVFAELSEKGIMIELFPGLSGVYTFDRVHEFALKGTRAFYDGKIYLQGIASLLPALALDPKPGENILDICAAPGSKTTQLAMMMGNTGSITALEQNQIRYDKLMHNCRLQGVTIVVGEKVDARIFLGVQVNSQSSEKNKRSLHSVLSDSSRDDTILFDRILLDAPCSAEGRILLSNEKSYGFWSLENTKKKAELQYELLSGAVRLLKSGGTLVYSTCTLAPEENEGVVARILEENKSLELQDIDIGLSEKAWWKEGITTFGSQLYPDKLKNTIRILPSSETEGFYMAKIVKK